MGNIPISQNCLRLMRPALVNKTARRDIGNPLAATGFGYLPQSPSPGHKHRKEARRANPVNDACVNNPALGGVGQRKKQIETVAGGMPPPHLWCVNRIIALVVDGQQRLTTLQLLIRAAQEAFSNSDDMERATRL